MAEQSNISERSRRVAKNTVFLYFRMLLLMFIGLFTSRLVLQNLGIDNFGTYNAVAGMVGLFSIVVNGLATASTRFLTCEIGKGEQGKVKETFSTSLAILLLFSAFIVILVETVGLWFLNSQMNIPSDRMGAAHWVLHCSAATMIISLVNIPYTAMILAHERMQVYAGISILEAILKISIAISLSMAINDKLKVYAVLMLAAAFIVQMSYAIYCRRNFIETHTGPKLNKRLSGEIFSFAGWNAGASGIFLFNTQGLNVLTNIFFGVGANAARGVAVQIENIVKQFVTNVVIALNPQITKSYASGDRDYSFTLANKGSKYAYLILLCFIAPALFEMQTVLELWLGIVPEKAALFCKLTLICTLLDLLMTTFSTVILADGRINRYYIWLCCITATIFPAVWISFKLGAPVHASYIVFILVYIILDAAKLIILHRTTGYPYKLFFKDVVLKVSVPTILTLVSCLLVSLFIKTPTISRMFITAIVSCSTFIISSYFFALTPGEKDYVKSKFRRQ